MPFDGIPGLDLYDCATELEKTYTETDFNVQWRWEWECRSMEPFEKSVASMDANAAFAQSHAAPAENESFRSDKYHYIAEIGGNVWDVDLTAFGRPDDVKVTYIITRAPRS